MEITDRRTLGDFWTAWCIDRNAPNRTLNIGDEPANNAQQLRVRDVERPAVWSALAQQPTPHGISSTSNIERIRRWLSEPYAIEVEAFPLPESGEWVICEGNHTSCALYLLAPDQFTVSVAHRTAWPVYANNPQLRSSGGGKAERLD